MTTAMNPVGWFEIPVNDMAQAKAFYEQVLGLELEVHPMGDFDMAWFPMREDATGAAGSLVAGEGYTPSATGILIYFSAPDLNATLDRARAAGGQVLAEKYSIGEYGFVAMILDLDGNRIGLHSRT